ncbi:MAG: hypothetical protein RIM23_05860 [Coleofasciculus sp. G3-WIS-01]|uniref:hypothetical protein n=1 Tax=Coleofasciculus sp. G3-WIS-01 TaxID=3069528 RepID=UPI003302CE76
MAPRKRRQTQPPPSRHPWTPDTELVGLVLELTANAPDSLYTQYTVGLHAWFLDQVRQTNPELSAYLHDGQSEKPFTLSRLDGDFLTSGKTLKLTQEFLAQRQRQGGSRAQDIAETWATILARREMGESLNAIADDLEMRYQTVKTYAKLARRAILNHDR